MVKMTKQEICIIISLRMILLPLLNVFFMSIYSPNVGANVTNEHEL